jgi:alkylation response protein AidB-like acyl-CoA dehydrogenase
VDFTLSAEESFFLRSSREVLEFLCPPAVARGYAYGPPRVPKEAWSKLAKGGWLGLPIPERYGGGDSSLVSVGLFALAAGRVLLPTIFRSSLGAALAILVAGTEEQRERYLPGLAAGSSVAAVGPGFPIPKLRLEGRLGHLHVNGIEPLVPNAGIADMLVLFATHGEHGTVALLLPRTADGVSIRTRRALGGEPVYEVRLNRVMVADVAVLAIHAGATERDRVWQKWLDQSLALLCMEMAGGSAKVLELTTEYMLKRHQFGRPLGAFQAVQHHLANMAILSDGAYATALQALWTVTNRPDARRETSIAKIWCSNAYKSITMLAHQLHAGIGYVRDSDLHLWSERAVADSLCLGTVDQHSRRLWSVVESDFASGKD